MNLETVINKMNNYYSITKEFLKKESDYVQASYFFISTRAIDFMTTKYALIQVGTEGEAMPVPKFFMEQLGIDNGLLIHQALIGGAVLAGAYYLNKRKEKKELLNQKEKKQFTSGNSILYATSAISLAIGINNYLEIQGISLLEPLISIMKL